MANDDNPGTRGVLLNTETGETWFLKGGEKTKY